MQRVPRVITINKMAKIEIGAECPNCGATLKPEESEKCLKCGEYPEDWVKQNEIVE